MDRPNRLQLDITDTLTEHAPDGLALCVFEGENKFSVANTAAQASLRRAGDMMLLDGEFKAEEGESLLAHAADEMMPAHARRLLFVGLGLRADCNSITLRRAAGAAVRQAKGAGIKRLQFLLPTVDDHAARHLAGVIAEGALLGFYENDFYKQPEDEPASLEQLTIVAAQSGDEMRASIERARIIAESVNWARTLADEPGGSLPPREFARRAAEMAGEFGLKVETIEGEEIKACGMGGLWGVGKGSDEPPALIVVCYEPEGTNEQSELWAFVGKGITFDTGGISIKPALNMEEMKSDMAGGAAVLGALRALAQMGCRRRLVGIIPSAENMPSGRAIKPGDVVRTLAGYTVECVDTDAEGRLVLIDGLAYARQLGAARIVDLATLTGSIIVALGDHRTGLFSNDDAWAQQVLDAAARAGEPAWRMPVSDDYKKKIESDIADFKNYGGRPDATGAALLLSKFAGETPWVHLDIAATSWHDAAQPHAPKGATGTGVRTLVELACA